MQARYPPFQPREKKNLLPLRTRAIRSPSDATKVARTLLVVMRCGSLSAAEDITGHKHETIGRWLRAAQHAQQITEVLVRELHLTVVEVDAFWSFIKKSASSSDAPAETGPRWGCLSVDRATHFVVAWAFAGSEDAAAPQVVAQTRRRTAGQAGADKGTSVGYKKSAAWGKFHPL